MKSYSPGQVIYLPGQPIKYLYLITSGSVDIQTILDGQYVNIDTIDKGGNMCAYGILGDYVHPYRCVARTYAYIHSISKESFNDLNYTVPNLSLAYEPIVQRMKIYNYPTIDF